MFKKIDRQSSPNYQSLMADFEKQQSAYMLEKEFDKRVARKELAMIIVLGLLGGVVGFILVSKFF